MTTFGADSTLTAAEAASTVYHIFRCGTMRFTASNKGLLQNKNAIVLCTKK